MRHPPPQRHRLLLVGLVLVTAALTVLAAMPELVQADAYMPLLMRGKERPFPRTPGPGDIQQDRCAGPDQAAQQQDKPDQRFQTDRLLRQTTSPPIKTRSGGSGQHAAVPSDTPGDEGRS